MPWSPASVSCDTIFFPYPKQKQTRGNCSLSKDGFSAREARTVVEDGGGGGWGGRAERGVEVLIRFPSWCNFGKQMTKCVA